MGDSPTDVQGSVRLVPRGRPGFPWATLVGDEGPIAAIGRYSALNIFLFRGQRIVLIDGRTWRLQGVSWHRFVCPLLIDGSRRKLATSAPGHGGYGITCRDRGFTLLSAEKRPGRPRRWQLQESGEPVASIRRNPYEADVLTSIPLPALLMSFGLAAFGVMGEKDLVSATATWATK